MLVYILINVAAVTQKSGSPDLTGLCASFIAADSMQGLPSEAVRVHTPFNFNSKQSKDRLTEMLREPRQSTL